MFADLRSIDLVVFHLWSAGRGVEKGAIPTSFLLFQQRKKKQRRRDGRSMAKRTIIQIHFPLALMKYDINKQ